MKLSHIFTILFIASLVLFVPLARQSQDYVLITSTRKTIVINIQNTELIISSNRPEPYLMELAYLDPEKGVSVTIEPLVSFTGENSFQIEKRGFYRIVLESTSITTITITTQGIPDSTLIIVSLMMVLAIGGQIQKQFSRSFDY